jgi:hypothetical protein
MKNTGIKFKVHAQLFEIGSLTQDLKPARGTRRLERSLNRLERVSAVYLGTVVNRQSDSLQIAFDTAEAAVLGACEMQQRCAALPGFSGDRLSLSIGIHDGLALNRATDDADSSFAIASLLATVDNGIVASGAVVATLNPVVRQLTQPSDELYPQLAVHVIDWRQELPSIGFGGPSIWPEMGAVAQIRPYLKLRHNLKTLDVGSDKPAVTVGRDLRNDVIVAGSRVSRVHCRIDRQVDRIRLTDQSTNGTLVLQEDGPAIKVRKTSVELAGKGVILCGEQSIGDRRGSIVYEVFK